MTETPITVRSMTPADVGPVVALLNEALGPAPGGVDRRALFEWKHLNSPFGPSIALVAEMEGEIVGLRSFMRWKLRGPAGEDVLAVRAVDTATSPKVQRRGIFSRLTTQALEQCEAAGVSFVFNTPNDKSRPGYIKMGWQVVTTWPMWVKVRRPDRLALAAMKRNLRSGPGVDAPAMSALVPAADALAGWAVEAAGPAAFHTHRAADYLAWRYTAGPMRYHALTGEGALVLARLRSRGNLREAVVCEALCAPGAEDVLRKLLGRLAKEAGADHAVFHVGPGWPARGSLLGAGFHRLPRAGMTFTVKQVGAREPRALEPGNWSLTLGDLEVF